MYTHGHTNMTKLYDKEETAVSANLGNLGTFKIPIYADESVVINTANFTSNNLKSIISKYISVPRRNPESSHWFGNTCISYQESYVLSNSCDVMFTTQVDLSADSV